MTNDIGQNIKKHRLAKAMTQAQLATACDGRSVNQLNAYEKGRSRPSPPLIAIIARALGVSPADLTGAAKDSATGISDLVEKLRKEVANELRLSPAAIKVSFEINPKS